MIAEPAVHSGQLHQIVVQGVRAHSGDIFFLHPVALSCFQVSFLIERQHVSFHVMENGGEGKCTCPFVCSQHVSPSSFERLDRLKPRTKLISF